MSKVRVGWDIDGVLADFGPWFLEYLKIEDKSPAMKWNDPRFKDNFHLIDNDEGFWSSIPSLFTKMEAAVLLKDRVELYCTARPIRNVVTANWLYEHNYPIAKVVTVGAGGSKVEALKDKVDIFIDDAIHNFEELNAAGINCYLLSRPHNLDYETHKRVHSVREFLEKVEELEKEK